MMMGLVRPLTALSGATSSCLVSEFISNGVEEGHGLEGIATDPTDRLESPMWDVQLDVLLSFGRP